MQVKFNGNVSAQAQAGETVKLTVTKPDATTDEFTATTLADKTYTATRDYVISGNFSVTAHVDAYVGADGKIYVAKDSEPSVFAIIDRTVTVNVSIA